MPAVLTADFSAMSTPSEFRRYHQGYLRLRDPGLDGPGDLTIIQNTGMRIERPFIKGDKWFEDPWPANPMTPDSNPGFTPSTSWFNHWNAQGIEPWICHEHFNSSYVPWLGLDSSLDFSTPAAIAILDTYEDMLVEAYTFVKTISPQTRVFEDMNEPFLANQSGFDGPQSYELSKRNIQAVIRVNALGLPGPACVSAGPSATQSPSEDGRMPAYLDAMQADIAWWNSTGKPNMGYWCLHAFGHNTRIDRLKDNFELLDTYIAGLTDPNVIAGIPRAVTAYAAISQAGSVPTADPDALTMADRTAFYAGAHTHFMRYQGPNGEQIEEALAFNISNYVDYDNTFVMPNELSSAHKITYGGSDGVWFPNANKAMMDEMVADGGPGVLVDVVGSGTEAWETVDPASKRGYGANAVMADGSGKAWMIIYGRNFTDNTPNDVTAQFNNLASAGIDVGEPMTIRRWTIDRSTSNRGNGALNADLQLVETLASSNGDFTAGPNVGHTFGALLPSIHLVEIEGTPVAPVASTDNPFGFGQLINSSLPTAQRLSLGIES